MHACKCCEREVISDLEHAKGTRVCDECLASNRDICGESSLPWPNAKATRRIQVMPQDDQTPVRFGDEDPQISVQLIGGPHDGETITMLTSYFNAVSGVAPSVQGTTIAFYRKDGDVFRWSGYTEVTAVTQFTDPIANTKRESFDIGQDDDEGYNQDSGEFGSLGEPW